MSIAAVVFDVGNVLYGWDPDAFLVRQLADDEERLRFIEESDFYGWHADLDRGRPFEEAAADLSEKFPAYAALIRSWGDRFGETITDPVPDMHELVAELDARGVPLFALTNFSADFWRPFAAKERAFLGRFRDIVVSGVEKVMKPDPAIYYLALHRFGLRADEALFIDDRRINVEGAEAIGMHGHVFTDAAALRERLVEEGLLPASV